MNLYKPLHARLCRYVQAIVWDAEEAKDLVSEVTLKAFEGFESMKQQEQFMYYLFGIARNLYLKKLRREKFRSVWHDTIIENTIGSDHAEQRLDQRELATLLAQLKRNQREAITLFEVSGFSYEEIAGIQQTTLGSVKATIFKARQALKIIMEKERMRLEQAEKMQSAQSLKMGGML